jgi:hypothetical protein
MVKYEPIVWDIETTGLNPLAQYWWNDEAAAQVTSIGLATVDGWREATTPHDADIQVYTLTMTDEYELLEEVTSKIKDVFVGDYWIPEKNDDVDPFLVGFNSRNFDHPYIGARFSRKRLNANWFGHRAKRLDMMRVAGKIDAISDFPSQDDYAEYLGYTTEDEYDGSMMPEFFEKKQMDKIEAHVKRDIKELAMCFVEDKENAMDHFYDHYGIGKSATFPSGVSDW